MSFPVRTKFTDSFIPLSWQFFFPLDNRLLLIFSITIVKCQWFLYFDDYHEQGPVRSTIHSALWSYLHFMLNLSQLLLGVGCLDLIRIYQLTRESGSSGPSHLEPSHFESGRFPAEAAGAGGLLVTRSVQVGGGEGGGGGMGEIGAGSADAAGGHDTAQLYAKKYYLIVAASVFFFNGTIKYVTSRPQGKLAVKGGTKRMNNHAQPLQLNQNNAIRNTPAKNKTWS